MEAVPRQLPPLGAHSCCRAAVLQAALQHEAEASKHYASAACHLCTRTQSHGLEHPMHTHCTPVERQQAADALQSGCG
jgi:hypothetical protein